MSFLRIRVLVCLCLVAFSCGFATPRPIALKGAPTQHDAPHHFSLQLSTQPEEQDTETTTSTAPSSSTTTISFDPELRRIMGSVATLGVLETAFLTYSKLSGPSLDICGTAGDCASVLNGPYSTLPFTNIPLASLGLIAYLLAAYLALEPVVLERDDTDENRIALLAITTAMGTFSVFLLSLIYGVLHTSCPYCLASACFSMTLAACTWLGGCLPERNAKLGVQAGLTSVAATTLAAVLLFVSVDPTASTSSDTMSSALMASTTTTTKVQPDQQLSPPPITTNSSPRAISISQDLRTLNAKMYGAYW